MRHLTVYQRLAMIIAVLSIAFFAVAVAQILVLRDAVLDERRTTVRDLVEAAGGLLAAGATADAHRVLNYLAATQESDGHWAQNMWLDGVPPDPVMRTRAPFGVRTPVHSRE